MEADLALGRHAEIAGELEALATRHPGRERLCRLAMLALYRCGRQGDALSTYDVFRRSLDEELGIAPSAELRELQVRILRQDPLLLAAQEQAGPQPAAPGTPAPVGRERELAALRALLADATAGLRRVALVTGEAGAGKTTLVQALLAEPGAEVLVGVGQCVEHHGPGEAYLAVFDAVARLARGPAAGEVAALLEEHAPTWLIQMPALAARADRATLETRVLGATPDRLLREILDFLDALAAAHPVVLVLEDLHWSDVATVDLVAALARRQEDAGLLVVATYRRGEARAAGHPLDRIARELRHRDLATEVRLEPLEARAIAQYLAERGLRDVSASVVAALRARDARQPAVPGEDRRRGPRPRGRAARPPARLAARARREPVARSRRGRGPGRVLEAAAVAGVEATAAAVAFGAEIEPEDAEELLAGLAARGAFIEDAGEETWPDGTVTQRYRFLHDACQEIVYDRAQPARRARLHRRVGTRLEQAYGARAPEISAQLAAHFIQGRDPVRGIRHLQLAAEQAFFQRAAPRVALEHVRLGLEVADSLPEGLRMRVELALRDIQAPSLLTAHGWAHEEAERTLLRIRELCDEIGEPEDRQWALFKLAVFYEARAQFVRSEALLAEALSYPEREENVEVRVDSYELLSCSLFHQSDFTRSVEQAGLLLDLWDGRYCSPLTASLGDNPAVAAHCWTALSLWCLGKADQARNHALEGIAMAQHPQRVPGQATAFAQAALVASLRREPRWTLELAEQAIEVSRAGGYHYRLAMGQILRGWALVQIEGTDEGLQDVRAGLALAGATGVRMEDLCFAGLHADACLQAGLLEEGLAAVEQARPLLRTDRTFFYVPELHRVEGELRARAGAPASPSASTVRSPPRASAAPLPCCCERSCHAPACSATPGSWPPPVPSSPRAPTRQICARPTSCSPRCRGHDRAARDNDLPHRRRGVRPAHGSAMGAELARALCDAARVRSRRAALDVGCGPGALPRELVAPASARRTWRRWSPRRRLPTHAAAVARRAGRGRAGRGAAVRRRCVRSRARAARRELHGRRRWPACARWRA